MVLDATYWEIRIYYTANLFFYVATTAVVFLLGVKLLRISLPKSASKDLPAFFLSVVIFTGAVFLASHTWDIANDIPVVMKNEYSSTVGIVTMQDAAGNATERRSICIRDITTSETIRLTVFYTPIRKGEIYEILYAPHSKIGSIVRTSE